VVLLLAPLVEHQDCPVGQVEVEEPVAAMELQAHLVKEMQEEEVMEIRLHLELAVEVVLADLVVPEQVLLEEQADQDYLTQLQAPMWLTQAVVGEVLPELQLAEEVV
jgi:hypothetical protein